MTRDTEARQSASRKKVRSSQPGLKLAIAITMISAVICWFWLASGGANTSKGVMPGESELTEVPESEIPGALTTMAGSNAALAQYRGGKDGNCRVPLAWVTLAAAPGEPASKVRLISGSYFSPVFDVSAVPIRVAIPFPAPYESGSGTLAVLDTGGAAAVSLLPAWRVSAQNGRATRHVVWSPVKSCRRNG